MTDARLRELERTWQASGSVEDEAAWLLERVRTGTLTNEQLGRAVPFSEAARLVWTVHRTPERVKGGKRGRRGQTRTDGARDARRPRRFDRRLEGLDGASCVRVGVAAVVVALDRSTGTAQRLSRAALQDGALAHMVELVDLPSPEGLQRVRDERPRLDDQLGQTARFAADALLQGAWEQGELAEEERYSVTQALRVGAKVAGEEEGAFLDLVDAAVARWLLRGSPSLLAR